jgi:hypothetical protein
VNAPRLVSCCFGSGAGDQWPRLARVLAYSAAAHSPAWRIEMHQMAPPSRSAPGMSEASVANTQKLESWAGVVRDAPDDDLILLIDADTMVLRSLDPVWDRPFDVAYTVRPQSAGFPFNAGVVFVRVNARSRAYIDRWRIENRGMLDHPDRFSLWRRRFGGINQAALGYLLSQDDHGAQLLPLPCPEWNCEDSSWALYDPAVTRIVHVKSALRKALFSRAHVSACVRPLARIWQDLERAAGAAEARATRDKKLSGRGPAPAPVLPAPPPGQPAGFHRYHPRGGRPKLYPNGNTRLSVRLPTSLYDACCRKALSARHKSMTRVVQEALEADLVKIP